MRGILTVVFLEKGYVLRAIPFIILLLLLSCTSPDTLPAPIEQQIEQPSSGPLAVNCVLIPELVQETCSLDSRINLQSSREDLSYASGHRCWIRYYGDFMNEEYPTYPSTAKKSVLGYDVDYLSELRKNSFNEFKLAEVGNNPSRNVPNLGESAFVVAKPYYWKYTEEPAALEDYAELALFSYQNGLVYQLLFSNKGKLTFKDAVTSEWTSEELPVCSVDEAVVLMRTMLNSMLGSSGNVQSYSGCALTTELIEERCDIDLQNNIKLFSRFINNQCEINALSLSGSAVASFKEISSERFDQMDVDGVKEILGVADRAYLKPRRNGLDLYFKTGERAGIFSTFNDQEKEEITIIDIRIQQAAPLGGACNEEEAKEIVREVLVPYLLR